MAAATRKKTSCPVYGCASELPVNQLPSIENVMQFYLNKKSEHPKTTPASKIASEVATKVIDVWIRAGIPTITLRYTIQKLENLNQELRNLMKKKGQSKETGIEELKLNSLKLFDIAFCKCSDFNACCCERDKRIPAEEREFITDQRGARRMVIGTIDRKSTSILRKRKERKDKREKYYKSQCTVSSIDNPAYNSSSCETVDSDSTTSDSSEDVDMQSEEETLSYNIKSLPTLSRECDRYGVSNTVGAAIATAVLVDYGIVTDDDKSLAIDRSKLWRKRERFRKTLFEPTGEKREPTALHFDSRKDVTICLSSVSHKCQIMEEHVCLLREPESVYLGHISPKSGSSASIFEAMHDFFFDSEISLSSLIAVGCDGTVVNTGKHGGIIRQLELHVGLQWFISMFHFNKLPLRPLFTHLDCTTAGPNAFTGALGKALPSCQSLDIIPFKNIDGDLPEITDFESLSKDQRYLYEMCLAVKSGSMSESLSNREPGKMAHSRWLTTANRIFSYVFTSRHLNHPKV